MRRRAHAISTNWSKPIATQRVAHPEAADFAGSRGLKVLEIGCGLGTDGAQFAEAGADYTGIDLTEAAVELAHRRFELFDLPGTFQTADAENLSFPDESFDLGLLARRFAPHPGNWKSDTGNPSRVASARTRCSYAQYHRGSYNYRINISLLRRARGATAQSGKPGSSWLTRSRANRWSRCASMPGF